MLDLYSFNIPFFTSIENGKNVRHSSSLEIRKRLNSTIIKLADDNKLGSVVNDLSSAKAQKCSMEFPSVQINM